MQVSLHIICLSFHTLPFQTFHFIEVQLAWVLHVQSYLHTRTKANASHLQQFVFFLLLHNTNCESKMFLKLIFHITIFLSNHSLVLKESIQ